MLCQNFQEASRLQHHSQGSLVKGRGAEHIDLQVMLLILEDDKEETIGRRVGGVKWQTSLSTISEGTAASCMLSYSNPSFQTGKFHALEKRKMLTIQRGGTLNASVREDKQRVLATHTFCCSVDALCKAAWPPSYHMVTVIRIESHKVQSYC